MNHIYIERTFHPVGQGAFFTECFKIGNGKRFNVVYDCGTNSEKEVLVQAINRTFSQGTQIDVVFISHLDKDHINGVKLLANNKNLTNRTLFVMPLFSKETLVLAYMRYGATFIQMFRTISQTGCGVLFVDQMGQDTNQENESVDLFENRFEGEGQPIASVGGVPIKGKIVKSGTKFKCFDKWEYVPFTPMGADAVMFQKEIVQQHIQLDLLLNALGKTKPTAEEKDELEKVKNIYKQVTHRVGKDSNKLNISSLILLSHKKNDSDTVISDFIFPYFWHYEFGFHRCWDSDKSACLYTGDTDFSNSSVYHYLMKEVMRYQRSEGLQFLQIPHHGSKNNYCLDLCKGVHYDCAFVNFGIDFHQKIFDPQLIMEYWKRLRPLALITEYPHTKLQMSIRL